MQGGDFLVARGNGSLSLVGRGGLVPPNPPKLAYPDTAIRIRLDSSKVLPEFFRIIWDSHHIRRQIESSARTTAGIYKINQQTLGAVTVPVPDIDVQRQRIAEAATSFAVLDEGLALLTTSEERLGDLTTALLHRAFSGQMDTYSPADEPATALIERGFTTVAVAVDTQLISAAGKALVDSARLIPVPSKENE